MNPVEARTNLAIAQEVAKQVEPKLARVTVADLLAEIQRHPSPAWGPAIDAVLARHIGEVIAP